MSAEKDILICVKTYPEYSTKYTETVCTAGIPKETKQLIRLYPITYRYLEGDRKFGKYQWITAEIQKNPADRRPESYKVNLNSIQLGDRIDSSNNWNQRKHWVLSTLVHKFANVFLCYAASRYGSAHGVFIFDIRRSRSFRVNFHSKGSAISS
jgi:hypothetical protein